MLAFSIQTMLPKETLQAVFNTLTESVSDEGGFSEFRQRLSKKPALFQIDPNLPENSGSPKTGC